MIQRIQSLFLFLSSAFTLSIFGVPFGSTSQAVPQSSLFSDALYSVTDHVALIGTFGFAGILALIDIFLFKNRTNQQLLGRIAIVLNFIGLVLMVIFFMQDAPNLGQVTPYEGYGLGLPVFGIIFLLFALRFISKDQRLVESMDRLR